MSDRQDATSLNRRGAIGAIALGIVVVVAMFVLALAFGSAAIRVVDVFAGTVLSATIALIYYQQTNIMSRQSNIDKKLLDLQKPALEVVDRKFDGNRVYLDITNYGNGAARDLELLVDLELKESGWFTGSPAPRQLSRVDEETGETLSDSSVGPREGPVTFEGEAAIEVERDDDSPDSFYFESLVEQLVNDGLGEQTTVTLRLEGIDNLGDEVPTDAGRAFTVDLTDVEGPMHIENVHNYSMRAPALIN